MSCFHFWRCFIFKFFINVLEIGVGFVLVLSVLFAIFRTEKPHKRSIVILSSIVLGLISSIIPVVLRSIPNYINRTKFAFWCMVPVVITLVFLIILIILEKKLKVKHKTVYENLFCGAVFLYTISSIFYYFPFVVAIINTFVNYGESPISTIVLFRLIGYILGITIICLSGLGIYKTLLRLSAIELKVSALGALIIFGITQLTVIIQRLYSIRIIPRNDVIFATIAFIVNHNNLFIFLIMVFIMFPPIILWRKNIKITEKYSNNAELRKIKAKKRNARRWAKFSLIILLVNIFSLSVLRYFVNREVPLSAPEDYSIVDGRAEIPLAELEDDKLHRYEYTTTDGISIRFIAIKKSEGAYGVGLDACDICGPTGYFERGNEVVCKLCDVVMNKATIGFPGGCNPVPIPYIVHDEKIKIKITDLESEATRFR